MRSHHLILAVLTVVTLACVIPYGGPGRDGTQLEMAVWGMPFEDRLFEDVYARGFETRQPVRVRYTRYDDNLTDKYFAWHVLDRGADVMRVRITDYDTFVARGMLANLDRFIDDPTLGLTAAEQADYTPAIWNLLDRGGSRYALPADNAQYGLYYNKGIFDRYNTAHPDDRVEYPTSAWTWEDLRAAARKLAITDERGNEIRFGVDFDLWAWPFMTFFAQAGGTLWNEDGTRTLIDSPEGVEALKLIVELLPRNAALRSLTKVGSASGPDKLFAGGQTAMLLDGSWRAPDLERVNPDLDFAIAPLPSHRHKAVVSGSVLWAISAHSRHTEMAWRMIKWMTGREQSLAYWQLLRVAPPARVSVVRSAAFRETPGLVDADGRVWVHPMPRERFDDRAAWLLDAITPDVEGHTPGFVPVAPYQRDLEEAIDAMLKRAVAPSRAETLRELLQHAATTVHRIIDRDRAARGLPEVVRP